MVALKMNVKDKGKVKLKIGNDKVRRNQTNATQKRSAMRTARNHG